MSVLCNRNCNVVLHYLGICSTASFLSTGLAEQGGPGGPWPTQLLKMGPPSMVLVRTSKNTGSSD